MEHWSGLMPAKAHPAYMWPMATPPQLTPQALAPWFWPAAAPPQILSPIATAAAAAAAAAALPKQTTITAADVGKVAYEMTYAPTPTPGLGPPVVQSTRETTITAADVGKWAFEMPEVQPFVPAPLSIQPSALSQAITTTVKTSNVAANTQEIKVGDGLRPRVTATKIFKDKATQKYLVFDKYTQTDPKQLTVMYGKRATDFGRCNYKKI